MILMLCTAAPGGMRSVVERYRADGVFDRNNVRLVFTHVEGSIPTRMFVAFKALLQVIYLLLGRQVDLVHIHVAMRGSFWRKAVFANMARLLRSPVLLHLHGSEFKEFYLSQPPWRQRLIRREFTKAARVLVLTSSWRDFVLRIAPRATVRIIPNYVAVPPETLLNRLIDEEVTVLFLGILGKRKGIFDLLPAFKQALEEAPHLRLRIGGNGDVDAASACVRELDLDSSVRLLGWISGSEKDHELSRADIFILPSYNEGLPMSILEAMAWGLPVVTTPVGGIPELVENRVDGLLVQPGDISGLRDALVSLAGDRALRNRLGHNGRRKVEHNHSATQALTALESVYAEFRT